MVNIPEAVSKMEAIYQEFINEMGIESTNDLRAAFSAGFDAYPKMNAIVLIDMRTDTPKAQV